LYITEEDHDQDADYAHLTPDALLDIVEDATGIPMTGLCIRCPAISTGSTKSSRRRGDRLIAKFYRPGRWSREALEDEHRFLADCEEAEIPVVCPIRLSDGNTLGRAGQHSFHALPQKGRQGL
jgi:hypothetical protein